MNGQMLRELEELKRIGKLSKSEIEGVLDLLWSTALTSVSSDKDTVKNLNNAQFTICLCDNI